MSLPEAVLFDLDGTLIDSVPDIAAAANELLALHGHAPLDLDAVRAMVGDGVGPLVERAFAARSEALAGETLATRVAAMMPVYARHLTGLTELLPGALDLVRNLHGQGVRLAVVSNKPDAFVREILDHYGFAPHLAAVQGAMPGLAKKPAPDMLLAVLKRLGTAPDAAAMVGDGPADAAAGRAAGVAVILLEAGYGERPQTIEADALVAGLTDVPAALARLFPAPVRS